MSDNEINENNKLIAEFLGLRTFDKRYPRNHGIGGGSLDVSKDIIIQRCKYHSDWNWLMRAVDAIEKKHYRYSIKNWWFKTRSDDSDYYQCTFVCGATGKTISMVEAGTSKLLSTYEAVIQFIKWHNNEMLNKTVD